MLALSSLLEHVLTQEKDLTAGSEVGRRHCCRQCPAGTCSWWQEPHSDHQLAQLIALGRIEDGPRNRGMEDLTPTYCRAW